MEGNALAGPDAQQAAAGAADGDRQAFLKIKKSSASLVYFLYKTTIKLPAQNTSGRVGEQEIATDRQVFLQSPMYPLYFSKVLCILCISPKSYVSFVFLQSPMYPLYL
jgi:hypothetical protein